MKSFLTISLLLISIEFNDVVNNQSLVRRAGGGGGGVGQLAGGAHPGPRSL